MGSGIARGQRPAIDLVVDISRGPGWIDLVLLAQGGYRAQFAERVGSRLVPLGSALTVPGGVALPHATRWRCDRLRRVFEVSAVAPDGTPSRATFSIRTPSCRERLAVSVPRRAAAKRRVRVDVRDRWGIGGVRAKLCVAPPRRRLACRPIRLRRDQARAAPSFRPGGKGRWRVQVRVAGFTIRRVLEVGSKRAPSLRRRRLPLLLATGDSTMQGIDSFLADKLAHVARVRSQVRLGTGISKPIRPSWVAYAGRQVRRLRPRVAVVSLGALDGFPMHTPSGAKAECCGEPWVVEYARRVRSMMRSYARRGAGRVLWLTLPTPRDQDRQALTVAVNEATRRAAEGFPAVTRVRLDTIFSPDGRYHANLLTHGRQVRVRSADGVHLSAAGTEIAAAAVVRALRDSGALPGLRRGGR